MRFRLKDRLTYGRFPFTSPCRQRRRQTPQRLSLAGDVLSINVKTVNDGDTCKVFSLPVKWKAPQIVKRKEWNWYSDLYLFVWQNISSMPIVRSIYKLFYVYVCIVKQKPKFISFIQITFLRDHAKKYAWNQRNNKYAH